MTATDAPYQILRHLVSPEICRLMFDYCVLKRDQGLLSKPDERIPTAARQYGDPLTLFFVRKDDANVDMLKYDGRTAIGAPRSSRLVMLQAKGMAPADVKMPADVRE